MYIRLRIPSCCYQRFEENVLSQSAYVSLSHSFHKNFEYYRYLYAQAAIYNLMNTTNGHHLKRLSEELEAALQDKYVENKRYL